MSNKHENIDPARFMRLIADAQGGNQESLSTLTELAQPQVHAYLLRSTLDKTLTDDLVQETLMQMVKSIAALRKPESFWPWLYRIATNKFNEHLRGKQTAGVTESVQSLIDGAADRGHSSHALGYKEMTQAVFEAMAEMKHTQRQVVAMRCFDSLSFAEIGEALDCSEIQARVTFHRSRKTLQAHLQRRGFGTAMTAAALVLFGQATSPANASTAYAAAMPAILEETSAFGNKSYFGIKAAKLAAAIAACLITIGGIWGYHSFTAASTLTQLPHRWAVKSFHYVAQSWDGTGNMPNTNLAHGKSLSKGAYEQWFFFPDGVDGPMFLMMQRWDPQQTVKLCGWLQNASGNYYYHSGQKTMYLYNGPLHLGNLLLTRRLPTDSAEFCKFLDKVEGDAGGLKYKRDSQTGLLTGALDNRFYNAQDFRTAITYNNLNEVSFGAFRHQWPVDTPIVDERDEMHKRGWTAFTITGSINGEDVHGIGRVPFIYDKLAAYPPALSLTIGNNLHKISITDMPSGAKLAANERALGRYRGGSFFKGLARPWMGMHTIDLLRRDAAEKKIWFKMKYLGKSGGTGEKIELSLLGTGSESQTRLVYRIDMERDIIEKIEFWSGDHLYGSLIFEFPQNVNELEAELVKQFGDIPSNSAKPREAAGVLWLFDLARGTLSR